MNAYKYHFTLMQEWYADIWKFGTLLDMFLLEFR